MIKMIRWRVDKNIEAIKSGRDEGEVGRRGHDIRKEGKIRKNMLNHWWFVFQK